MMDGEENEEEDMEDEYGDDDYPADSQMNNFQGENALNTRFAFMQQFYGSSKPQPDVVDETKPFVLNFDSMYPIDSTRMQFLRDYLVADAIDKFIT